MCSVSQTQAEPKTLPLTHSRTRLSECEATAAVTDDTPRRAARHCGGSRAPTERHGERDSETRHTCKGEPSA
eukprot:3795810-Prymnesium_polylepis.1